MENQTMLSKTIGMQRTAFTNTLSLFSTMHQQGENLLKTTMEQNPWLPKSSKNACFYWSDIYSKYLENLNFVANQGFAEIEKFSSPGLKLEKNESQQKNTTEKKVASRPAKKSPTAGEKTVSAKKTEATNTSPPKKQVAPNTPTEKPVTLKTPSEKLITHEKTEVKKPEEVKAEASAMKPSTISQPITKPPATNQPIPGPAPGGSNKEAPKKTLK
jgi:hypothetical protein